MKPIFLASEQIFGSEEHPDSALPLFSAVGTVAPPSDLALLTVEDDGFAFDFATHECFHTLDLVTVDK